jgi:pimeloyl-ACP methyl ester carboxylesterase
MMVHGMCCTGDVWSRFRTLFEARGARVFTPTLRPDARTTIRSKPNRALKEIGFSDYLQQLEGEIARISDSTGQRPAVIGHSMGGLLTQALAERNLVEAAVLICPSTLASLQDTVTRLFFRYTALKHRLGTAHWAINSPRRLVDFTVFNRVPEAERQAAYEAFVYESGRAFNDLGHWSIDETRIRVPILTVAARQDRLVPAKLVRRTGKKYATVGGEFVEYREHGHWLYGEPGWEKPASDIYDWLDKALQRPRERAGVQAAPPSQLFAP